MILGKRPDIERFLAQPAKGVRVALIYGRDRGVVRERADRLAKAVTEDPSDPFNVSLLTETDLDGDRAKLADELSAQSLMGGRRLVRLKLTGEKASIDRATAEAAQAARRRRLQSRRLLPDRGRGVGPRLRPCARRPRSAEGAAAIPCYEDEPGDVARLVREALAQDKVGLNAEALELFVARLPKERGVARQEIERLTLYLGPGSGVVATPADLTPFLGVEPDASLAEAAQDAFGGKLAAAHAGLRRAAAEGEGGPAAVRAMGIHLGAPEAHPDAGQGRRRPGRSGQGVRRVLAQ